jgi:hypothetical protein
VVTTSRLSDGSSTKAIAAVPKPSAPKPPTPAPQQSSSGMPNLTSTATSQADYDKLKPQGTQGTVGGLSCSGI